MSAVNRYHPDSTEFSCEACQRQHAWGERTYLVCPCGVVAWKFETVGDWEDAVVGYPMNDGQRARWREQQADLERRLRADRERQRAELNKLMGSEVVL